MEEIYEPMSLATRQEVNRYMEMPDNEFMDYSQASNFLKVPIGTLEVWVRRGEIPFIKPFKRILFRRSQLAAYLMERAERHARKRKHIKFDYKTYGFKKILVLPREEGKIITEPCVFCKKRHIHSGPQGHRSPHCETPSRTTHEHVTHPDGTVISREDGYFIKTIKPKKNNTKPNDTRKDFLRVENE